MTDKISTQYEDCQKSENFPFNRRRRQISGLILKEFEKSGKLTVSNLD